MRQNIDFFIINLLIYTINWHNFRVLKNFRVKKGQVEMKLCLVQTPKKRQMAKINYVKPLSDQKAAEKTKNPYLLQTDKNLKYKVFGSIQCFGQEGSRTQFFFWSCGQILAQICDVSTVFTTK